MNLIDISQELRLDKISTRFEAELRADRSPRIEQYLRKCSKEFQAALLEELISLELWYAQATRDHDFDRRLSQSFSRASSNCPRLLHQGCPAAKSRAA